MTAAPTRPAGPLWPWLALYAAAAVWIAFSGIHRWHNADSFIFSLASLYAWTPFFWQQDRVGMLVPLLASVCPDPVMNVVLQTGLTVFAGLCVPLLLVELIYPHPATRAAATFASAAMLVVAPDRIRDNLLYECCYPVAMALGCAGVLVLGRGPGWPRWWRVPISAALLGLAHWEYLGVPLWLGPLTLLHGWLQPGEPWPRSLWRILFRPVLHPRTMIACVLIVLGFWGGYELMNYVREVDPLMVPKTDREALPREMWADSWKEFAAHMHRLPRMYEWETLLGAAAGLGLLSCVVFWRWPRYPIFAAVPVLLIPAAAEFLFMGTRQWAAHNDHHPRYMLGTVESVQALLVMFAALPLAMFATSRRSQWILGGLAALTLFACATDRYGFPSPHRPRQELDELTRQWTEELTAADVDAMGGDYWIVWPAVYHMNLVRRDHNDNRLFYGIAYRGRVQHRLWDQSHPHGFRVAVLDTPIEVNEFFRIAPACGLTVDEDVQKCGPFLIYYVRPTTARP